MISHDRFGPTLARLLMDSGYTRRNNNPDWVRFVAEVPSVSYETLRKAVADERPVSERLMRRVAAALNVEPTVFVEYRLLQVRRELDPREVGWTRAIDALRGREVATASLRTSPWKESHRDN